MQASWEPCPQHRIGCFAFKASNDSDARTKTAPSKLCRRSSASLLICSEESTRSDCLGSLIFPSPIGCCSRNFSIPSKVDTTIAAELATAEEGLSIKTRTTRGRFIRQLMLVIKTGIRSCAVFAHPSAQALLQGLLWLF